MWGKKIMTHQEAIAEQSLHRITKDKHGYKIQRFTNESWIDATDYRFSKLD